MFLEIIAQTVKYIPVKGIIKSSGAGAEQQQDEQIKED